MAPSSCHILPGSDYELMYGCLMFRAAGRLCYCMHNMNDCVLCYRHYADVGVQANLMYVDLLHDPALPEDGLLEVQAQFQTAGAHTRTILHHYTPDLQDLAMITGLAQMPMEPEDWVIVADMDEYFTYGTSVQDAVQAMEEEGASFALGELLLTHKNQVLCNKLLLLIWHVGNLAHITCQSACSNAQRLLSLLTSVMSMTVEATCNARCCLSSMHSGSLPYTYCI